MFILKQHEGTALIQRGSVLATSIFGSAHHRSKRVPTATSRAVTTAFPNHCSPRGGSICLASRCSKARLHILRRWNRSILDVKHSEADLSGINS